MCTWTILLFSENGGSRPKCVFARFPRFGTKNCEQTALIVAKVKGMIKIEMKYKIWKKKFKLKEHQIIFMNRELGESKLDKKIILEACCPFEIGLTILSI